MTEYLNAWVLGGDGRYRYAADSFREMGIQVKTWGVPGMEDQSEHLETALDGANLVLLPMKPFSEGVLTIGGESVEAVKLPKLLADHAILAAGSFPVNLEAWLQDQGITCVSFLELDSYLLKNAAVTAEGAVCLVLNAMQRTLYDAQVLVIGWGRIGRFLSGKLKALGAQVTVAARKNRDKTEAQLLGMDAVTTGQYESGLASYDVIINTVPNQVITAQQYQQIGKDCVLLELASLPGGFPKVAEGRVIMGQALPGKTAPKTAGENLAAAVLSCIDGEGRNLE